MSLIDEVFKDARLCKVGFCKYLSSNDTGETGTHQEGIYIAKASYKIIFDEEGIKGENKTTSTNIKWQNDSSFMTDSRFKYYGCGTRNEYRITKFGRGFPFLKSEYTGSLFILFKMPSNEYKGYIIENDDDIDSFLDFYGISPTETNSILPLLNEETEEEKFKNYIKNLTVQFPLTKEISEKSRELVGFTPEEIKSSSDKALKSWLEMEYKLFKAIERDRYSEFLNRGFDNLEELVSVSNTILNRRKSRAGKSLENHLAEIFRSFDFDFEEQAKTEGRKKPDFIFPSEAAYNELDDGDSKLIFLGAKTTCKDRWRQILNEANKIPLKHLFTLQEGISHNQLGEMKEENVKLVVLSNKTRNSFSKVYWKDKTYQESTIVTLTEFISYLNSIQDKI